MTKRERSDGGRRPRRTQQERTEETRARLVQATIACIGELGYAGTTLTEITRRAGVSIGGAQHHFQTKTDLIFATVNYVFTEMHTFLRDIGDSSMSMEERIDALLETYWRWFGSPTYLAAWELVLGARHDPALFDMIRDRIAVGVGEVAAMWRESFADSAIDDAALNDLVQLTLDTMRGMALRKVVRPEDALHDDRMLALLRSMLRRSLAPGVR